MGVRGYAAGFVPWELFQNLFDAARAHLKSFDTAVFENCSHCCNHESLMALEPYLLQATPQMILELEGKIKLLEALILRYERDNPGRFPDPVYLKDGELIEYTFKNIDVHALAKSLGCTIAESLPEA